MRVEQEQRVTEDARIYAEQDAAAQRHASQVLQVSSLIEFLGEIFGFLILYLGILTPSDSLCFSTQAYLVHKFMHDRGT